MERVIDVQWLGLTKFTISDRQEIWINILSSESLFYRAGRRLNLSHTDRLTILPTSQPTEPWILDPTQGDGIERGTGYWSTCYLSTVPFCIALLDIRLFQLMWHVWDMWSFSEGCLHNGLHPQINFSNTVCIRITWGPLLKCRSPGSNAEHSNTAGLGYSIGICPFNRHHPPKVTCMR